VADERADPELRTTVSLDDASLGKAAFQGTALQDEMTALLQDEARHQRLAALRQEIMALEQEMAALEQEIQRHQSEAYVSPELLALAGAVTIYSKAFLETLAKRHADGFAELLNKRFRKNGKKAEAEIGVEDGSIATIAIMADTPDEARLALLDLDVTADAVRGKVLRWDSNTSAWRPADES
jgi:hypothetical protein